MKLFRRGVEMQHPSPRQIACLVLLATAALLVWAAPASATYVSGKQTLVGGGKKSTYSSLETPPVKNAAADSKTA